MKQDDINIRRNFDNILWWCGALKCSSNRRIASCFIVSKKTKKDKITNHYISNWSRFDLPYYRNPNDVYICYISFVSIIWFVLISPISNFRCVLYLADVHLFWWIGRVIMTIISSPWLFWPLVSSNKSYVILYRWNITFLSIFLLSISFHSQFSMMTLCCRFKWWIVCLADSIAHYYIHWYSPSELQ